MKCIINHQTNHIRRVKDSLAFEYVESGLYSYINKTAYKEQEKRKVVLNTMRGSK